MKKTILSLVVLIAITVFISCKNDGSAVTSEAKKTAETSENAALYKLDLSNSVVDWKGTKPTGFHTGTIQFLEGEARVSNGTLESGTFIFDMNSITVTDLKSGDGKEDLETHLKGTGDKTEEDHFFNVGKYPKGSFEITQVTQENGKASITGNLTLKEISKSITFSATLINDETSITLKSAPFRIDRTLWKINYASKSVFEDLKDKFVDDTIELTVNLKVLK